ncbi:unnamed protein product [Moneuplotes crassus]|uniref:Uncharacterized protein n=1 Tax=Euplotes crassus TaxID=5936 RepID=A0AAD1U3J4_EUPCR|nr:unnamed protein product [Moneuplotes crassus]
MENALIINQASFPRLGSLDGSSFSQNTSKLCSKASEKNYQQACNEDLSCVESKYMDSKFSPLKSKSVHQKALKRNSRTKSQHKVIAPYCNQYLESDNLISKLKFTNYTKFRPKMGRVNMSVALKRNENIESSLHWDYKEKRNASNTQEGLVCLNTVVLSEKPKMKAIVNFTSRDYHHSLKARRSKSRICEDTTDYSYRKYTRYNDCLTENTANVVEPQKEILEGHQTSLNRDIPMMFNNFNIKTIFKNESLHSCGVHISEDGSHLAKKGRLFNCTLSHRQHNKSNESQKHTNLMSYRKNQNRRSLNKSCNIQIRKTNTSWSTRKKNPEKLRSNMKARLGGGYTNGILAKKDFGKLVEPLNTSQELTGELNSPDIFTNTTRIDLQKNFKNTLYSQSFKRKIHNMTKGSSRKTREKHFVKLNDLTKNDITKIISNNIGKSNKRLQKRGDLSKIVNQQSIYVDNSPSLVNKGLLSTVQKKYKAPPVSSVEKEQVPTDYASIMKPNIL